MRLRRCELWCDRCQLEVVVLVLPQGAEDLPLTELAHRRGWRVDLGGETLCAACRVR